MVRPDLVVAGQTLFDVKTLNGAGWHYLNRTRVPFNPISVAEKKQDEVPNEYLDHINALDEYTHPRNARDDRDTKGPLQNKFENLGLVVKGLVVGLFGETSPRVTEFIDFLAQQGATIHLQALRNEVDGTLAHSMEALNARPTPAFTGGPAHG